MFIYLILILLTSTLINSSRFKRVDEQLNYAKICNATWNSNFVGKLEKCGKECSNGFECLNEYCCPTKETVCIQSAESGNELTDFEHNGRFYYDHDLKNCLKFSFFGASESFNNFVKFSDCKKFCSGV